MSNSFFELFKKAQTLIPQVVIEFYKPTETGGVYIFKVKGTYTVTLNIMKVDETKTSIWKREFSCDCRAFSRNSNELCSHVLACQTFLVVK